jgi:hypothetical protein
LPSPGMSRGGRSGGSLKESPSIDDVVDDGGGQKTAAGGWVVLLLETPRTRVGARRDISSDVRCSTNARLAWVETST